MKKNKKLLLLGFICILLIVFYFYVKNIDLYKAYLSGSHNKIKLVSILTPSALSGKIGPNDESILHFYVSADNEKFVAYLLKKGLEISLNDKINKTPIFYAKSKKMIKCLIEKGASLYDRDAYGELPIHNAAKYNYVEAIRTYVDFGVPIDAPSLYSGYSPLFKACAECRLESVSLLLDLGANPNFISDGSKMLDQNSMKGDSPLHISAARLCSDAVKVLLFRGANPFVENSSQDKVVNMVFRAISKYSGNIRMGIVHGQRDEDWLKRESVQILTILIDKGVDLNERDYRNRPPIEILLNEVGDVSLYQNLVDIGLNINEKCSQGEVMINMVIARRELEVLKFFERNGAEITYQQLEFAAILGRKEIGEYLISKGFQTRSKGFIKTLKGLGRSEIVDMIEGHKKNRSLN